MEEVTSKKARVRKAEKEMYRKMAQQLDNQKIVAEHSIHKSTPGNKLVNLR